MTGYIFFPLMTPFAVAAAMLVIYQAGGALETIRTLVMYSLVMNVVPFFIGQAIFTVYAVAKKLTGNSSLFVAYVCAHFLTSTANLIWPRPGTFIDQGAALLYSGHLALIVLGFGIVWLLWLGLYGE